MGSLAVATLLGSAALNLANVVTSIPANIISMFPH